MSPAGIPISTAPPIFDTAYAETVTADTEAAKARRSRPRAARIVNLDRLPPVPSLFDPSELAIRDRPSLGFLTGFRRDVSRPIDATTASTSSTCRRRWSASTCGTCSATRDGNPSTGSRGSPPSEGGRNVVLFVRNEQCIEADGPGPLGWDEGKLVLRLASHGPLDLTADSAG